MVILVQIFFSSAGALEQKKKYPHTIAFFADARVCASSAFYIVIAKACFDTSYMKQKQ